MDVRRGDIFWVKKNPFRPAVGNVQEAERPAIIVSNNIGNKNSSTYECVFLTTQPKNDLPTHVTIRSAKETSTALCEQITTVGEDQLGAYMGKCTPSEMTAIDQALLISLGIDIIDLDQKVKAEPAEESTEEEKIRPSELDKLIDACAISKELELYKKLYHDLLDRIMSKS